MSGRLSYSDVQFEKYEPTPEDLAAERELQRFTCDHKDTERGVTYAPSRHTRAEMMMEACAFCGQTLRAIKQVYRRKS